MILFMAFKLSADKVSGFFMFLRAGTLSSPGQVYFSLFSIDSVRSAYYGQQAPEPKFTWPSSLDKPGKVSDLLPAVFKEQTLGRPLDPRDSSLLKFARIQGPSVN